MGKQAVAVAVVGKQELGEAFLPARQKCTTASGTVLVKGDSGMCVCRGWGGIRKTKANWISF